MTQEIVKKPIKKKKKNQCKFSDCCDKISVAVGTCKWCSKSFCLKHRLPEAHLCTNFNDCKQAAIDKNTDKIKQEDGFLQKKIKLI